MKIGFSKKYRGMWQKSELKKGEGYLKSGKAKNLKSRKFDLNKGGGVFIVNTTVFIIHDKLQNYILGVIIWF